MADAIVELKVWPMTQKWIRQTTDDDWKLRHFKIRLGELVAVVNYGRLQGLYEF